MAIRLRSMLFCLLVVSGLLACGGGSTMDTPIATVSAMTGDGQTGTAGAALPAPLSGLALDAKGAPITGRAIDVSLISGSEAVRTVHTQTDSTGMFSFTWTLGTTAGLQQAIVTGPPDSSGAPTTFLTFSAQAAPAAAAVMRVASGDGQTSLTFHRLAQPVRIDFLDQYGNGTSGPVATFTAASGTLVGEILGMPGGSGAAQWNGYFHEAGVQTVTVSGTGLASTSFSINVVANPNPFDGQYQCSETVLQPTGPQPAQSVSFFIEGSGVEDASELDGFTRSLRVLASQFDPATGTISLTVRHSLDYRDELSGQISIDGAGSATASGTLVTTFAGQPAAGYVGGSWSCQRL